MPVHHVRIRKNIIEGVDDICRLNSGRIKPVGEFFNIDKLDLDLEVAYLMTAKELF